MILIIQAVSFYQINTKYKTVCFLRLSHLNPSNKLTQVHDCQCADHTGNNHNRNNHGNI